MSRPEPKAAARVAIYGLASAAWAMAGLVKIVFPSEARIGSYLLAKEWVAAVGAFELLLAAAWWIPRSRRLGALTGLVAVMIFATAMIAGVVSPDTCGCFGALQVSVARHKLALGLLAILGALGLLVGEPKSLDR